MGHGKIIHAVTHEYTNTYVPKNLSAISLVRLFDTDPEDESETTLGSILSENEYCKREDVFLIVKVHPRNLGKEATRVSIERSMKRLKTDYIDLVLIKAPSCDTKGFECDADENRGTWQESWKVMEEMNKTGSIRSIGVSNFKISQLKELMAEATVPVSVLQARFDLMKRNTKLRKFCNYNGIRFMAHSLLGFGWVKDGSTTNNPILSSSAVMLAARKYRTSPASILIRYALDRDITVVPRSSNQLHIALNKFSTSLDNQDSPEILEDLENIPHVP
ncbi:NAD(P)H-dependent D-xylose reductase-like [Lingula anatina]|uniref:NAD(P)H-dependent D-xylose reductase-like n=1 Tax=Lingula anatina TaxID=7574 RepID=A0A1S3JB84_LINAN|nr:NAD(P)H-dependent D-xylose reductase-like [Lingula anatina]|eukprot:XP_013407144.1 NAD(P)H-dependent D-xylose reductase-like [Lingula anatina]